MKCPECDGKGKTSKHDSRGIPSFCFTCAGTGNKLPPGTRFFDEFGKWQIALGEECTAHHWDMNDLPEPDKE